MGIIARQSIKATIVTYIGVLIGTVTVMYVYPLCLSSEQIGLTRLLLESAVVFSMFSLLGVNYLMIRYNPVFKNNPGGSSSFFQLLFIIPFIGTAVFIIAFVVFQPMVIQYFGKNSLLFAQNVWYIVPLTFFSTILLFFEGYSAVLQRIVVPKIIHEILVRVLLIILIVFFYVSIIDLKTFLILLVGIYFIAAIIIFTYVSRLEKIHFRIDLSALRKIMTKEMLVYTLLMFATGTLLTFIGKIDMYMISLHVSLKDAGIYTIAFFLAMFIEMPTRTMIQISSPIAATFLKENRTDELETLYKKISINQYLISGFIFLCIWININDIFRIMPHGEVYEKAKWVVFIIGLSKVYDAVTSINVPLVNFSTHYRFNLISLVLLMVLCIISNYLLIPIYGIAGAAIATLISFFVYKTVLCIFLKHKMHIQPFTRKTIYATLLLAALFSINELIPFLNNVFADIAVRTLVLTILFIASVLIFKISDDVMIIWHKLIKARSFADLKNIFITGEM